MDDLEITKRCAEAIGPQPVTIANGFVYLGHYPEVGAIKFDPLHDDEQMVALIKRFRIKITTPAGAFKYPAWKAVIYIGGTYKNAIKGSAVVATGIDESNLNRAVCLAVAKLDA